MIPKTQVEPTWSRQIFLMQIFRSHSVTTAAQRLFSFFACECMLAGADESGPFAKFNIRSRWQHADFQSE